MKKIMPVILTVFVGASVIAAGISFSHEPFDVEIIRHSHMVSVSNKKFPELKVDHSFTDAKKTYQLRYSLFKQIEDVNSRVTDIRMLYSAFALSVVLNVTADTTNEGNARPFNDNDVKKDFNGDFGTTVLIEKPKSEFAKGYQYMMINFYCKENYGLVVQSILFNDMSFLRNENLLEIFYSFKFK